MNAYHNAVPMAVRAELCPKNAESEITPLEFTRVGESWRGDAVTNTQAELLISELREWLVQFSAPEAFALLDAVRDFERLFTRVWTEIDEALQLLQMANREQDPERSAQCRAVAMTFLHRWQDRGGRVGNVK